MRSLEGQTLDLLLLLYSLDSLLLFDMHKTIVKNFHFWRSFRSFEVIRRSYTEFATTVFPGFPAFV